MLSNGKAKKKKKSSAEQQNRSENRGPGLRRLDGRFFSADDLSYAHLVILVFFLLSKALASLLHDLYIINLAPSLGN